MIGVASRREYNGGGAGCRFRGERGRRPSRCKQQRDVQANQFGSKRGQPVIMAFRPAERDAHILSLDEASFAQPIPERCNHAGRFAGGAAAEEADNRLWLLRPRNKRPRRRAAEQRYELTPFQLTKLHYAAARQAVPEQHSALATVESAARGAARFRSGLGRLGGKPRSSGCHRDTSAKLP